MTQDTKHAKLEVKQPMYVGNEISRRGSSGGFHCITHELYIATYTILYGKMYYIWYNI